MYIVGVDRSWFETPFLRHSFLIKHAREIEALRRCGIREITIDPSQGLAPDSPVETTPEIASPAPSPPEPPRDPAPHAEASEQTHTVSLAEDYGLARGWYERWSTQVQHLFDSANASGTIEIDTVKQLVEEMIGEVLERAPAYFAVMTMRRTNPKLYEHGLSVCALSLLVAHGMGFPNTSLQHVGIGALLHDIGLLRLPHNIVGSLRTLTPPQRKLYDTHPAQGVAMLEKSGQVDPAVLSIVEFHHRSLTTPQNMTGSEPISFELSRLVAIMDEYDDLITGMSMPQQPMSSHTALKQLYHRYQPYPQFVDLVSQLVRVIGVYPLYSLVELNTGERGIVTAITPGKAHKPVVSLIQSGDGEPYTPPVLVDLAQERHRTRTVDHMLGPREYEADVESVLKQVVA